KVTSSVSVTVAAPQNQAPTVASAASASPNPVTGLTTTLSVLGADDGGAANLSAFWTASGPVPVTDSADGINAARTTTARFTQAGTYNFLVSITDAGGLSVTSSVSVIVSTQNQTPTVATAASATPNPVTGRTTTLSVLGADDGGT